MPVKIAASGTHSTGKTVFLTRLRHLLETAGYHVSTVADQTGAARDHGFPVLREQTATTTLWLMTMGIAAELVAGRHADVVLVDRPIIDALGYHTAAHAWRGEPVDPLQASFLADLARHHAPSYHLIYQAVVDPNMGIAPDACRDNDPAFRDLADQAITAVYGRLAIPTLPLHSVGHTTAVRKALQLARRAITPHRIASS
jgi:AAA domain